MIEGKSIRWLTGLRGRAGWQWRRRHEEPTCGSGTVLGDSLHRAL